MREWKQERKRKLVSYVKDIFAEFRDNYDSDIFFPHAAGDLSLDDEVLEQVINGLYENPETGVSYKFSEIDADVLGNIYEQYLASILRKGGGLLDREAKRKEMGIYYTPTYIVDYIVKNTLGELLSKAKSAEVLEKIRVLDPACGSGSFLIRAYEALYDAYQKANGGDNEMLGENVSKNAYSILTKNLHGVDLDPKAVEIAELNLLLKAVTRRGLLPPLSENIKCGNSLISGTEEELEKYFGKHWEEKRPFNWEQEFPEVMKEGGFDVVIGNPPYGAELEEYTEFIKEKYRTNIGKINSYRLFIERAISLVKNNGFIGFIVPNTWLSDNDSALLRKEMLTKVRILKIVVQNRLMYLRALLRRLQL